MKIASYNLENLFDRPKILNLDTWTKKTSTDPSPWTAAKDTLADFAALNALLRKPKYSAADKTKIVALLTALNLKKSDESPYVLLRQNKGHLVKRTGGKLEIVADGRDDWTGWLDLKTETVDETATRNTARVVKEIGADILATIEVENRIALSRFNELVLAGSTVKGSAYEHVMLIDGNDERGIDVGLITGKNFPILSMQSHVDDKDAKGARIFSRDCAHYEIGLPGGASLIVLVNHFKSKGYGSPAQSNARRKAQAARVREIYDGLRADGVKNIAVVGDFNDTPDSDPIGPLVSGSGLKDITEHPKFHSDGRPGTFGNGTKSNKIDYILLSPDLFARVTDGGIFRKGVWGGKNGDLFPHLPTITKASEAASDHAVIWAELNLV